MPGCSNWRIAWTAPNWKQRCQTQNPHGAQLEAELRQLDQRVTELLSTRSRRPNGEAGQELPAELADCKRAQRLLKPRALERKVRSATSTRSATSRPSARRQTRRVPVVPRPNRHDNPTDPDSTLTPTGAPALHPGLQTRNWL